MSSSVVCRKAFEEPAGTNLAGIPTTNLDLDSPLLTYGAPYDELCAKHVQNTFHASRVYIIASGTLSHQTDRVERLISSIGRDRVVGVKKGMAQHTPWTDIIDITNECRQLHVGCIVTLGAGSLTDGGKIIVLVSSITGLARSCAHL
jgi:alcohol dehydrogenase class IV